MTGMLPNCLQTTSLSFLNCFLSIWPGIFLLVLSQDLESALSLNLVSLLHVAEGFLLCFSNNKQDDKSMIECFDVING